MHILALTHAGLTTEAFEQRDSYGSSTGTATPLKSIVTDGVTSCTMDGAIATETDLDVQQS